MDSTKINAIAQGRAEKYHEELLHDMIEKGHDNRNAREFLRFTREGYYDGANELLPLLVECREYINRAEHKVHCEMGIMTMEVGRCTCGRDTLLSKLDAMLSLNPVTQKT